MANRKQNRVQRNRSRNGLMRNDIAGSSYDQLEARNLLAGLAGFSGPVSLAHETIEISLSDRATDSVRDFLSNEAAASAYLTAGNDLELVTAQTDGVTTNSLWQQTIGGIPVHDAFVTVIQSSTGSELFDNGLTDRGFELVDETGVTLEQAISIADSALSTAHDFSSDASLVRYQTGTRLVTAWQVDTVLDLSGSIRSNADFETIIDANTGTILEQGQPGEYVSQLLNNPESETGVYSRIVINDAIGPQGSRDYAAPLDAVGALTLGCTGSLIAPDAFLTARHCGTSVGSTIVFGDDSSNPDFVATVASVNLPDGNGSLLDGGDVAILTLNQSVPSSVATPLRLIDATTQLVGSTAATVGYGFNGVGSQGHQFSADDFRWGGENIIDAYGSPSSATGSNIFSTDFDDGSNGANTIGGSSSNPLQFEATTAPGDSGGPILVQNPAGEWLIAGVLSGGTTNNSVYGDISWWTGTAEYRTQIEAVGGQFDGGGLGSVNFDLSNYRDGDVAEITVFDDNATGPISVTLQSSSGDSETLTLTGSGPWTGNIAVAESGFSAGDGILQGQVGDTFTVVYVDSDNGAGSSQTVTDTANLVTSTGAGVLVGVDFGAPGGPTPLDWQLVSGGNNTTLTNLNGEDGSSSGINLEIEELADGSYADFAVTPAAGTIPQHTNGLANLEGQIFTGGDSIRLTYSGLNAGAAYEIYVFSAEGFFDSISQTVTITGDTGSVSFDQNFGTDQLFINDQLGDSSRNIAEYAQIITADVNGVIEIQVDPLGNTQDVVLAGLAISEVQVESLNSIGESGTITNLNQNWQTITLSESYVNPVIVFGPLSTRGSDPSVVRLQNVSSNSFEVRLQEFNYLDGTHTNETVSYIVVEAGIHELEDGTVIQAGNVGVNHNFSSVTFDSAFSQTPVVLSQTATFDGADTVVTRQRNISSTGFDLRLQEQQSLPNFHLVEQVGWIAIESASGTSNGAAFESGTTGNVVTNGNFTNSYSSSFGSAPVFLAAMQSYNGTDTASLRYRTNRAGTVTFYVAEERSSDNEVSHIAENVGYFALESGLLFGVTQNSRSLEQAPAVDPVLQEFVNFVEVSAEEGVRETDGLQRSSALSNGPATLSGSMILDTAFEQLDRDAKTVSVDSGFEALGLESEV